MKLREYQSEAVEKTIKWLNSGRGNPLIVLPTGSGKSVILASLIKEIISKNKTVKVIVAQHVKELVAQNHKAIKKLWPDAPTGIYSAGLRRKQTKAQIIFASVQSARNNTAAFGDVDIVFVDEAHLVPKDTNTSYRKFISELADVNPNLKVVGLTATPYRLDSGLLYGGDSLFDDIAYEVPISLLIDQGYLAPLTSKLTETTIDIRGVKKRGGDFIAADLEKAVDVEEITIAACAETVRRGVDRKSWLVFAVSVDHAESIARNLRDTHGVSVEVVTGKSAGRDRVIREFKAGKIKCLVSVGVLTTGFDAPCVDLIAMLRPTASTSLFVQMAGRGMRIAPNKVDCLTLDFAGNVARHGPVDLVNPNGGKDRGKGEAPTRVCVECQEINPISAAVCRACGAEFERSTGQRGKDLTHMPARKAIMARELKDEPPEVISVSAIHYNRHEKPGKPPSMRVDYMNGWSSTREWVCFEHEGFAKKAAARWWKEHGGDDPVPANVNAAIARAKGGELNIPTSIDVKLNEKGYKNIVGFSLEPTVELQPNIDISSLIKALK